MKIHIRRIKYDTYQPATGRTAIVFPPLPTEAEIGFPRQPSPDKIGLLINRELDLATHWLTTSFEYRVDGTDVWTPFECDLSQVKADRAPIIAVRGY